MGGGQDTPHNGITQRHFVGCLAFKEIVRYVALYIQLADGGAVSPRRHPSGKICSKVRTSLPHSSVLPGNKKLFRAGGVKDRRLAGTEKQAVCRLIYSFVMHIEFDNRSSALPYVRLKKKMLRHPRRSGRGNWRIYGTVPATAKGSASDAARSCAETATSLAEHSARKTAVLRFFFSEHKGKEKRECCRK